MAGWLRCAGLASFLGCLSPSFAFGAPPVGAFARLPHIDRVSISPNGQKLAWRMGLKDKHVLVVLDLASGQPPKGVLSGEGSDFDIWYCRWANDTRLLCSLRTVTSERGFTWPEHRLIGINPDGSQITVLMKNSKVQGSNMQDRIVDMTPDDPQTVLISAYENKNDVGEFAGVIGDNTYAYPSLFELNVDTGTLHRREQTHPPIYQFITDRHGVVRIGIGFADPVLSYYARLEGDREWRRLDRFEVFERSHDALQPVAIGEDPNTFYAIGPYQDREALWQVDLTDKEPPRVLFSHAQVDVGNALFASNGRLLGLYYETDRQYIYYTDPQARAVMETVNASLPGKLNWIADASRDEQSYVIASESDVDEGTFYLYELARKKLRRIAVAYPDLDPASLGAMRAISYPARDGTSIPGYLTVPPGVRAENLPLIVMPHGGPINRDSWGFFFLQQFLVSRGYAVLQMNFRGSSGYGRDWYYAAHQDWGGLTYDDVTDGARWAVKQGIADPKRICIVGWSFGGYLALLGAERNADLYRCSVSIAGISDLMVLERFESKAVKKQIGTNWAKLKEDSARRHADQVKMPVLMIHGDLDYQVEVEQSQLMARALKQEDKPFQFIQLKGATHQLDRESDRVRMLTEVEKFLRTNLGPGVQAPSP
ncbi:MAG: alpha/beta hydrolase family protein [Steroidobacterales bacterium]